MAKDKTGYKLIAQNKKAYHEYFIEEKIEAGIELKAWSHRKASDRK